MSTWASTIEPLLHTLDRQSIPDEGRLRRAVQRTEQLYAGRAHWTGVSFLEHTAGVLKVLLPFQPDEETVMACLLQHVLKTRQMDVLDLEEEFGAGVRALVSGVHLLSHVTMRNRKSSIEDLRLMLLSVSDDVRVLLIILCERCYVLEHLAAVPAAERRRICRDVLSLFAPVAARLGIYSLKQQLELLAFPQVYASDAQWIAEQIESIHKRTHSFLDSAALTLIEALREQGIEALVQGREKQPYSIFTKMKTKTLSHIESLPDLFALRVIVQSDENCYRVLGLLHRMGRPLANRFKDYISFPKPNGYQSLHTTVSRLPGVPEGVFIEIQIRTQAMHREAEFGIAAHWSYKQRGSAQHVAERFQLQQVLTSQQSVESAGRAATLADHIFVLTPKGDIVELPEGATPLDFAFQIHTDLGLSFRAARVNSSIVSLDYELQNGDVVEILSHRVPQPSPEWMQMVKMASSRSRLKRYLHSIDRSDYVQRGKETVNAELKIRRQPPLDSDLALLRRFDGKYLTFEEREDLLMKIGQGSDRLSSILLHLDLWKSMPRPLPRATAPKKSSPALRTLPVEVEGGVPMPLRFAKCCSPQKSDHGDITGFITRTGDVMIHLAKCRMVQHGNAERRIAAQWRKE